MSRTSPSPAAPAPAGPLAGLSVLITRPAEQAPSWARALGSAGARVVLYPTIETHPPPSWDGLDACIAQLGTYDWLVLTSATATRFTLDRLAEKGVVVPPGLQVAAVGSETARALATRGVKVAVIPEQRSAAGLASALSSLNPGARVLFPQALGGRDDLRNALAARGAIVDVVPASQTLPINPLPPLPPFDVATFASPSALRPFVVQHRPGVLAGSLLVVIGPTTAAAARSLGLEPVVAESPDVEAIIAVIARNRPPQTRG